MGWCYVALALILGMILGLICSVSAMFAFHFLYTGVLVKGFLCLLVAGTVFGTLCAIAFMTKGNV